MLNIPISLLETVTDNIKTTIEKKYGDGKSNYLENYEDY
jgi:hypothetical protein